MVNETINGVRYIGAGTVLTVHFPGWEPIVMDFETPVTSLFCYQLDRMATLSRRALAQWLFDHSAPENEWRTLTGLA
jgi:hypothetical protein